LEFVKEAFSLTGSLADDFRSNPKENTYDHIEDEGACALSSVQNQTEETFNAKDDVIQLETTKILELFPSYGVGYIRRLLAFYANSSERVIEKILEGKCIKARNN
jgi:CUE domain